MVYGPKTLVLDLESAPNLAHVWQLWKVDVGLSQLIESGSVISFAAKWTHEKKVHFFSDHHDGHEEMIQKAWEMIDEAQAVIHFNGTSFDMPWMRSEFLLQGLTPPSPVQEIDLLRVARKNFRFPSYKLQYISTALGLQGKVSHTGHQLWIDCLAGDPTAWSLMKKYNKNDVVITEKVYDILRPWIQGHPHVGLFTGVTDCCPRCGSTERQKRGFAYTGTYSFQQWKCLSCGSWHRDSKSISTNRMTTRAVA